jgi:hypothetical protein
MKRHVLTLALVVGIGGSACVAEVGELDEDELDEDRVALSGEQRTGPLDADADLGTPPPGQVSFSSYWNEHVNGPLFHGARLSISVDPSRFPTCGTSGIIRAGIAAEDGTVDEVELDGGESGYYRWGEAVLPAAGREVQIWLWVEGPDGCVEYDSDFGRNYRFELNVWRPVRVRFDSDWTETVEGELEPGGVLVVDYDWERLPDCRVIYRGFPGWEILAHIRFDTGDLVPAQSVTRPGSWADPTVRRVLAIFPIPEDAHHAELWFENGQYPPTCRTWDSDYGRNYHFDF